MKGAEVYLGAKKEQGSVNISYAKEGKANGKYYNPHKIIHQRGRHHRNASKTCIQTGNTQKIQHI